MNEKRYIQQIVRRLQCTKQQKKEIQKQLKSDIQAALLAGDSMKEIQERMGNPVNVAREFNENFKPEEKKQAKKEKRGKIIWLILCVCIILGGLLYWWFPKVGELGSSGLYNVDEVQEQIETVIDLLNAEDYETLADLSDKRMKPMFAEEERESWKQAKDTIESDWGKFVSLGNSYTVEIEQMGKKFVIAQINASYENVSVTYTITFDEEMKLAGLYMR